MENALFLKSGRLSDLGTSLAPGAHRIPARAANTLQGAEEIIAAAEAKAERIVQEAQEVYESEKARGFAEGKAEGSAALLKKVMEEQAALDRGLAEMEAEIAKLSITVARAVIGEAAAEDVAVALTQRALREMRRQKRADLHVAPHLVEKVKERVDRILQDFPEVELLNVVEDSALAEGIVVLESKVGRVDADVEVLLAEFDAHLARITRGRAVKGDDVIQNEGGGI